MNYSTACKLINEMNFSFSFLNSVLRNGKPSDTVNFWLSDIAKNKTHGGPATDYLQAAVNTNGGLIPKLAVIAIAKFLEKNGGLSVTCESSDEMVSIEKGSVIRSNSTGNLYLVLNISAKRNRVMVSQYSKKSQKFTTVYELYADKITVAEFTDVRTADFYELHRVFNCLEYFGNTAFLFSVIGETGFYALQLVCRDLDNYRTLRSTTKKEWRLAWTERKINPIDREKAAGPVIKAVNLCRPVLTFEHNLFNCFLDKRNDGRLFFNCECELIKKDRNIIAFGRVTPLFHFKGRKA